MRWDDKIHIQNNVAINATIDGGSGDDELRGGAGADVLLGGSGADSLDGGSGSAPDVGGDLPSNDILVGGDGDDSLKGGKGRDVLIGGLGSDKLEGGDDDDLLIGGFTSYDENINSLKLIMAEWNSSNDYVARAQNLRSGTGVLRNNQNLMLAVVGPNRTVFDDGQRDDMNGNDGRDWFFADLDAIISDNDKISGRKSDEWLDQLLD